MKFVLGGELRCDLAVLMESRLLIQAQSGGGKSRTLRRILEQTHGKVQQIVIDPEGEFSTLREKFDYVLAAPTGGDALAHPRTAGMLAERLLELGVSAVVDLYELKPALRIEFVKLFFEALVNAPKHLRHPVIVAVDEAQMFAPEGAKAESAAAVADLAVRGRKRGLCLIAAVARLSEFDKAVAAPLQNKLIGMTSLDLDMKRAAQELGFDKAGMLALRTLEKMQFWAFGPAIVPAPTLVTVGDHVTTHLRPGARLTAVVPPPTEKIKALLPQLADLPKEAEQRTRTLQELQRDNATLRGQLTRLERAAPLRVETKVETQVERVMVPMLTEEHLAGLRTAAQMLQQTFAGARGLVEQLTEQRGALTDALHRIDVAIAQATKPVARPITTPRPPAQSAPTPRPLPPARMAAGDDAVSGVAQRILDAIAELELLGAATPTRELVAFLAGYAHINSKGFSNGIGALRSSGLIEYGGGRVIALTPAGRARAQLPEAPRTAAELQERVIVKLGGASGRILRPLLDAYPEPLARDALVIAADYAHANSKGFTNALGRLRTLGFVDYPTPGQVRAAPVLFLEGAA